MVLHPRLHTVGQEGLTADMELQVKEDNMGPDQEVPLVLMGVMEDSLRQDLMDTSLPQVQQL